MIRTSETHPLLISQVRASDKHGYIGITFCPGKYDKFAVTGIWQRDLGVDLDVIKTWNAKVVLTLLESDEMKMLKVTDLEAQVSVRNMQWINMPIRDFSVPDVEFEQRWLSVGKTLRNHLRAGDNILVHCKGGLGRAGMIAARLLVELGMEPKQAIRYVRHERQGAIETPAQVGLVQKTQVINDD